MKPPISDGVSARLSQFLDALGQHLWDSRQRASFAMYVLGLLSEQRRKSVESISTLFVTEPDEADAVHQRLLHFLGAAPWPDDEVRRTAVQFALSDLTRRVPLQSLIVDDTSFPKSGSHSVGVQRQYCGSLGKVANCQVVVSLSAATERAHLPIDAQPYLPQGWTDSEGLRKQARIPSDVTFRSKPDLALSMLARAKQNGIPSGVVLADAGYGDSGGFRDGVRRLGLHFAVGIQLTTKVQLVRNEQEQCSVQTLLSRVGARPFRRYAWREGTKKTLEARFAFFRVRVANSESHEPIWLLLERRDGAAQRDRAYLCSLPAHTTRKRLIYVLKDRWCTEAVYQESKQQLGLGQYQGRLYTGLQHHLSAVICTYAFIVAERERASADATPSAAPMQRTKLIPQRHSPYSIATLRKQLAFAIGPWLFDYLEAHGRRRTPGPHPTSTPPQADTTGG